MKLPNEERRELKRLKEKYQTQCIDHWEYGKLRFLTLKANRINETDERWR